MKNALVNLVMSLEWQDNHALHVSRQYFSKANLWRDIFPAPMSDAFPAVKEGAEIKCAIDAGALFQSYDPRQRITIRSSQFNCKPRPGRF